MHLNVKNRPTQISEHFEISVPHPESGEVIFSGTIKEQNGDELVMGDVTFKGEIIYEDRQRELSQAEIEEIVIDLVSNGKVELNP